MKCEIITIGDELLIGQIINTNAAWIAQKLNEIGVNVSKIITIGDDYNTIFNTLDIATKNNQLVLLTGGLGPTSDDITKKTLCDFFNSTLIIDDIILKDVENFIASRKSTMNELNRKQAEVPNNAKIIRNTEGTAPALWFEKNNCIVIAMPGVPFEMQGIMTEYILPELKKKINTPPILHKHIITNGIAEAQLAEKLQTWEQHLPNYIKLAYLPSPEGVRLRLSCYENIEATDLINKKINELTQIIGNYIVAFEDKKIEQIIGEILIQKKQTLAIAESCTGGYISHLITSIPGSSNYFKGAIIAYSNTIKQQFLSVSNEILEKHGAVSQQTVEAMASEILQLFNTNYAIATSGIAGPDGGTREKPLGTTWIAVASKKKIISNQYIFGTQRERNIRRAATTALNLLKQNFLNTY